MSFLFLSSSSVTSKPPYSGSPRTALRSAASWAGARRSGRRLSRYLPVEMIRADRRSPSSLGAGRVTSNPGRQDLVYLLFTCPANTDRVSIDGRLHRPPAPLAPSGIPSVVSPTGSAVTTESRASSSLVRRVDQGKTSSAVSPVSGSTVRRNSTVCPLPCKDRGIPERSWLNSQSWEWSACGPLTSGSAKRLAACIRKGMNAHQNVRPPRRVSFDTANSHGLTADSITDSAPWRNIFGQIPALRG